MNLVGYTATALSRNDITDTPKDKNVVSGAIVELKTLQGDLATIYDDVSGTNPETQKTCDSDGQCTFYAEAGDYNLEVNGKANKISLLFNKNKVVDLSVWGERFVGYFVDGFTYTKADDVAKGIDGKYYRYSGASAYPVVVSAGTVPSGPEYTAVVLSDAESVVYSSGSVSSALNSLFNVYHTAVRVIEYCTGDGVVDDNQGLKDAWNAFLAFPSYNKRIDFSGGTYRITEEAATCMFSVADLDKLDIHFGGCEFITDHSNTSNLQNLFDLQGCNNVTADLLQLTKPTAKAETSNTLYGFLVRNSATRGGKGYWLKGVSGKNSGGIRFQGDATDYAANGINSTLRPKYGYIDSIKIDNSDMQNVSNIATEKSGYGLSCAFGGDHVSVGRLDVDRIHRAFFVYGIKDIHVLDGEIRNSDATTINIAGYGTCIDVTLKARLHQDIPRSMNLVQVHGHELGVSGGASIDIENGRTHNVFDISLDLKATGAGLDGHENLVYVDKYYGDNNEGAGNDSDYYFKNISVKVNSTTTADTVFFPASNQYNALNVTTEQISLSDSLLPNGRLAASLLEKSIDSILVKDSSLLYFTPSPQPAANNDLPYTLENIHGLLNVDNTALYGSFLVVKDCVINNRSGFISASNCDPYNKIMYRTRLGGAFIEEKGRYDVYTNQNDSTKMYNPNGVEDRLFGGAVNVEASVLPSISTTMNIGDGAGDFTADCYVDGVVGGNLVTVDNVKNIVISVSEDNSSYGIFRGTLTAYGNGSDFASLVVALQIDTVLNIGAANYSPSDISFNIVKDEEDPAYKTMTFTCGNSGRYMSVAIR